MAACAILATAAFAQDRTAAEQRVVILKDQLEKIQTEIGTMKMGAPFRIAVGPTVKGAPYSAEEITESTQLLSDGTRIHNEQSVQVYRDGEGRVRRETPDEISIFDPVAGVSYVLDPKTMTARKSTVSISQVLSPDGKGYHVSVMQTGHAAMLAETQELAAAKKATAEIQSQAASGPHDKPAIWTYSVAGPGASSGVMVRKMETRKGETTSLGKRLIEGVESEGTRTTSTIETGAIGNDRPIQIVGERWYSAELQLTMMTRHEDPRSGEEIFRLTNVRKGEPGAYLFQLPSGYQLQEVQHK
jgi:hypothetical protein